MVKLARRPAQSLFVSTVAVLGFGVFLISLIDVLGENPPPVWIVLGVLAMLAAPFSVKVPGIDARISFADAFIFTSLILFGVSAGCLTAVAASLTGSLASHKPGRRVYYAVLNMAALSISAYLAGGAFFALSGRTALYESSPFSAEEILLPLSAMAMVHFVLNSVILAVVVSFDLRKSVYSIWRENLLYASITCFVGAAMAGIVAVIAGPIRTVTLGMMAAMLVILYYAHKTYSVRLEDNLKRLREVNTLYLRTVETLATVIDAKEQVTHGHARRVQIYARELAVAMGVTDENAIRGIEAAALLHDIGNLAIPEYILNKPGQLTPNEYQKIMAHPTVGADMLALIDFPYPVEECVRHHHECWDGSGYPDGLRGLRIPLGARILAIVDCYEALTSARPYREALSRETAWQTIRSQAGIRFDPEIVSHLERILDQVQSSVRDAELQELNIEGLKDVATKARDPEKSTVRRARDLLAFQDISSMHREVFALYELAQTLGSTLNLQETLLIVAGKIEKIVPFVSCVIYLIDAEQQCVRVAHSAGANPEAFKGYEMALGENLSGWVAIHNRPVVNKDSHSELSPVSGKITEPLGNALVYPLIYDGKCLGVISLYASPGVDFKDDHVRIIEIVSKQAATAIHNAMIFEETQEDAFTDRLTKLPNSRYLFIYFEQELQKAIRFQYPLTIFCMDLDGFKEINDCYGHASGDRMLVEVAKLLKKNLRGSDAVVRYAGDEFIAILPQTSMKDGQLLAKRVQVTFEEFHLEVRPGKFAGVGISIGQACFPSDGDSLEALMMKADESMYQDKVARAKTSQLSLREEEPVARQLELNTSNLT